MLRQVPTLLQPDECDVVGRLIQRLLTHSDQAQRQWPVVLLRRGAPIYVECRQRGLMRFSRWYDQPTYAAAVELAIGDLCEALRDFAGGRRWSHCA